MGRLLPSGWPDESVTTVVEPFPLVVRDRNQRTLTKQKETV
jgi:hypothetical protein